MAEDLDVRNPEKEIANKAKLLVGGVFDESEIKVELSDKQMPRIDALQQRIEEFWEPRAAKGWFAGPLVRIEGYDLLPNGTLQLVAGRTDFKEYVGTRDIEVLREYGLDKIANPISTSTAIVTSDGRLVIAQHVQGDVPGAIDAIGGYVDPVKDCNEDGTINMFKAARREIEEETRIEPNEINEMKCLGLSYEYADLCHYVASFIARTSLTSQEIKSRHGEEVDVIVVDPEKLSGNTGEEYVMKLLAEHYPAVEPDGRLTIALGRKYLADVEYSKRILRTADRI